MLLIAENKYVLLKVCDNDYEEDEESLQRERFSDLCLIRASRRSCLCRWDRHWTIVSQFLSFVRCLYINLANLIIVYIHRLLSRTAQA